MSYPIQGDLNVKRNIEARNIYLSGQASLIMSGNALSVTGPSAIDQDVRTTANVTFNKVTLTAPILTSTQATTKSYVDSISGVLQSEINGVSSSQTFSGVYFNSGNNASFTLGSAGSFIISDQDNVLLELKDGGDVKLIPGVSNGNVFIGAPTTSGNLTVYGDLTILGTTTTLNSQTVTTRDNIILLNSGEIGAGVTLGSGGISINRGSLPLASLLFNESNDTWTINNGTVTGIIATLSDSINSFSGTLNVNKGGTGATTFTTNGLLYGNGTSPIQATAASTINGALAYTATSGSAPSFTSKININDGALPQLNVTAGSDFYIATGSGSLFVTAYGTGSQSLTLRTIKAGTGNSPSISLTTGGGGAINTGNIDLSTGVATGTAGIITFGINGASVGQINSNGLSLYATKYISINSNNVLSETTLGSTVVNSSLTSVGTLVTGTWNASVIDTQYGGTGSGIVPTTIANGELLIGDDPGNRFVKTTLTAGSGITITNGPGSITLAVDFSASVTAGSGLVQTANEIDVVSANGGIVVNTDNIALTTTGSTLEIISSGIRVAANGITGTQLNTSVAGSGLTGGGGSALAVGAGVGVIVNADTVDVDVATLAGSGIASTGNVFSVNPDNATIKLVGDTVALKKYTVNINVSDWGAPSGGYSTYTINAATHGYSDFGTVKTYAAYSGTVALTTHTGVDNYLEFQPDRVKYDAATNAIELRVVNDGVTDARYAARIIIG